MKKVIVNKEKNISSDILIFFLILPIIVALSFQLGFRDPSFGADFQGYLNFYLEIAQYQHPLKPGEYGFFFLSLLGNWAGISANCFFAILSLFQFLLTFLMFKKLSTILFVSNIQQKTFLYVALATTIFSPFFWSGLTNVIRHALAVPFVVLSLCYFLNSQYAKSLLLLTLATMFHRTSIVFGFIGIIFLKSGSFSWKVFLLAIIFYVTKFTDNFMMILEGFTKIPVYSLVMEYGRGSGYKAGFRFDFLLFTLFPLFFAYFLKHMLRIASKKQETDTFAGLTALLSLYASLVTPFLLFGYAAYSNRWLFTAWALLPAFPAYFAALFVNKRSLIPFFCVILFIFSYLFTVIVFPKPWF